MPSLDTLRSPANGQILSLSKPLSKKTVEAIFKASSIKSKGKPVVRTIKENRSFNGNDYAASLISFPITSSPSIFPQSSLREQTYSFLLLIEISLSGNWYLGIFRKSTASIVDELETHADNLPRIAFTNAFSDRAAINRLNLQRMTVSKHELRAASYEAADLKTSLPMMSTSRCAIRSIRFSDEHHGSLAITISTSRVQQSGGRRAVDELADLVVAVAKATTQVKPSSFLSMFAQAIPLNQLPIGTEPNSILFDWSALLDNGDLELRRKVAGSTVLGRQVKKGILTRILGDTSPLLKTTTGWEASRPSGTSLSKVTQLQTMYSVKSILGNRLVIHDTQNNESVELAKWVKENSAFSITFSLPDYFFGNGALYHRADFNNEVEVVRRCFDIQPNLGSDTSEKGKPNPNDTDFPSNSVFNTAENSIYHNNDWLCCTDLGDEWADYICIRNNALLFVHCKHGSQSGGASCFQEVIGQALKNLGRARCTPTDFEVKLNLTQNNRLWSTTKIERLRNTGKNWTDFRLAMATLLADPDSTREVHLVVTMLSSSKFEESAAKSKPEPHFIQLIWLLASFINSCRELGAKPVVVCQQ